MSKEKDNQNTQNNTEWEQWCELYEYVKHEILQYDENMQLPKFMIYRLRGLHKGNFIANKKTKPMAHYGYDVILLTFKICKPDILKAMRNKTFKDEQHKFNYIMTIIESNINDVVLRLKRKQRHKEQIKKMDISQIERQNIAKYRKKSKELKNDRLKDLW